MHCDRVIGVVCVQESKVVGFCLGDVTRGEVLALAVLPEYERRGIGTRLLSSVVERIRSAGCESLWLAASADPRVRAHGFYRSLGWRPNGQKQVGMRSSCSANLARADLPRSRSLVRSESAKNLRWQGREASLTVMDAPESPAFGR